MARSDSVYMAIYNDLRGRITSGVYAKHDRLPTEVELGKTYEVSRVTSRKALEMLERDGLIYRRQGAGSFVADLSSRASDDRLHNRMVAMLLPFGKRQGRAMDLIRGAGDYLTSQGYYLNIQICEHNLARERETLESILRAPISGVLFYPISDIANVEVVYAHLLRGCRVVTIDKRISNLPIPAVVSDNLNGSYGAVRYLVEHGHTRIGYVSDIGTNEAVSVRDRYLGYSRALFEAKVKQTESLVSILSTEAASRTFPEFFSTPDADPWDSTFFADFYKRLLGRFLDSPDPATAIHTVNDYVAHHILVAAQSLGVKVPDGLSVIGFDDIELAAQLDPPLTTVRQDFYAMGREGARILLETQEVDPRDVPCVTIPTTLVERKSVATLGSSARA